MARITTLHSSGDTLAVGDLARAECLVAPFRNGDAGLEARYRAFFRDPDIHVLAMTAAICERARACAAHPFKLPDALHLATAIEHGCGLFLTNDGPLARFAEITVELLQ